MPDQLTQDDLLGVIDRALPDTYLDPIKAIGPGYELLQAYAKVGERASLAVKRFEDDVYILTSKGGALATVQATFYRSTFTAGAGVMLAGTIVRASRGGQVFRTTADASFGPTDLEAAPVTAVAIGYGYEWNIAGPFVDPQGNTWPGELDTIDLPLQNPVFFDDTIQVRNDTPADGLGRPRTLDALGAERGLKRQPNEADSNYRIRIRTLPDTVSPAAILRQLTNYFRRLPGLFWRHIETWRHEYQECYDAPAIGPTATENYDSNLFVYDDPDPPSPLRNRWLGEIDYLGAFYVEVARPPATTDYGFAYDDQMLTVADTLTDVGQRAFSAFDVASTLDPASLSPAFDGIGFGIGFGLDFGIEDFFVNLSVLLDDIRAGGVFAMIVIKET